MIEIFLEKLQKEL